MKRRITFQESIFLNPSRKERVTCSMFKNIRNFNIRKHKKRENRNIKKKTKRGKKLSRIIPFQRRKFKRKGTRPDKTRLAKRQRQNGGGPGERCRN